ncbi:hypothetical protein OH77DRAFT_1546125, partial [Trametes cingulata]
QLAELYAVDAAVHLAPPFAPLYILSDSRFAVDGLTLHYRRWEDQGWLGVAHADLMQKVLARLRARSAPTSFKWVKGHAGDPGNEGADALARRGTDKPYPPAPVLPSAPLGYTSSGVWLTILTQRLAYKGIKARSQPAPRRSSELQTQRVLATLLDDWGVKATPEQLWAGVRHRDIRRRLRDFWWKALHDALRVGSYWEHIPGYETRATCPRCDETESLEHILTGCAAPGQAIVWSMVRALLSKKRIVLPPTSLGTALAAPILTQGNRRKKGHDRLLRIVMTESVYLIWKLRCERLLDDKYDAKDGHHPAEITTRWLACINSRLSVDKSQAHLRLGAAVPSRAEVLATWQGVLADECSLPEDWVDIGEVLVGNPLSTARAARGVG